MAKCVDCGYLTVRHYFERNLVEAESKIRKGEQWPAQQGTNLCLYERTPLCFVMANKIGNKSNDYSAMEFRDAICEERNCDYFIHWQQGFTPKEHREMIDRKEMLKWQADREDADRKWREKQNKNLVIIAGGFTILGAVIGALIALFH